MDKARAEPSTRPRTIDGAWFAAFAILLILTRAGFLTAEYLDWDEATYILRAANIIDGAFPRFDVWYLRPPAFTGALRLTMDIFGPSILTVRTFGASCVFISSCFTFLTVRRVLGAEAAGLGICAVIAGLSALTLQSTSAEQLVIALLSAALFVAAVYPNRIWSAFLTGILMSLATLTRMNIGYAVIALGLVYLPALFRPHGLLPRSAPVAYALGGLVPLAAVIAAYWASGSLNLFYLFNFGIVLSYAFDQMPLAEVLRLQAVNWRNYVLSDPVVYGTLSLLLAQGIVAAAALAVKCGRDPALPRTETCRVTLLMGLVGGAVLLSILSGGAPYSHYWIQMFPFAAFAIAAGLAAVRWPPLRAATRILVMVMIALPAATYGTAAAQMLLDGRGITAAYSIRQAADRIAADRRPGDKVFALSHHLILWYLHEPPISPVVSHPADVIQLPVMKPLIDAGLTHADEFARILDSRPRYLVKGRGQLFYLVDRPEGALLDRVIAERYDLWATIGDVEVYRLR